MAAHLHDLWGNQTGSLRHRQKSLQATLTAILILLIMTVIMSTLPRTGKCHHLNSVHLKLRRPHGPQGAPFPIGICCGETLACSRHRHGDPQRRRCCCPLLPHESHTATLGFAPRVPPRVLSKGHGKAINSSLPSLAMRSTLPQIWCMCPMPASPTRTPATGVTARTQGPNLAHLPVRNYFTSGSEFLGGGYA